MEYAYFVDMGPLCSDVWILWQRMIKLLRADNQTMSKLAPGATALASSMTILSQYLRAEGRGLSRFLASIPIVLMSESFS